MEDTATSQNDIHFHDSLAASIWNVHTENLGILPQFSSLNFKYAHWQFGNSEVVLQKDSVSNAFQALKLVFEMRKVM